MCVRATSGFWTGHPVLYSSTCFVFWIREYPLFTCYNVDGSCCWYMFGLREQLERTCNIQICKTISTSVELIIYFLYGTACVTCCYLLFDIGKTWREKTASDDAQSKPSCHVEDNGELSAEFEDCQAQMVKW